VEDRGRGHFEFVDRGSDVVTGEVLLAHEATDFQRLYALFAEYENSLPPDLRHGVTPDAESIESTYAAPSAAFLALSDGVAAGCLVTTMLDARSAVMARLYVKPEHRGRGIARALVTTALELMRQRGSSRVVLDTDKTRLRAAYDLYVALGFAECDPYGPVSYATPTFMELRLS
jgi:ribosomal protein S18 acetylase RimI-like enzyme